MNFVFHPGAEAEHLESIAYFESKNPGLGVSYINEFENAMKLVCAAPHRYPIEKEPDIRRIRMKRFPYSVLYRESAGVVQVLAIAHYRRRPAYWLGRR